MTESLAVETGEGAGPHAGPPPHYGSVADEYGALTEGAGLLDRSHVGRLSVSGEDALDLLNRLTTNDLTPLTSPGQGTATVLTTPKGRILALLVVLTVSDGLLLLTSPQNRRKVADWIDFYTIMDDVTVHDETEETAMVAVIGPGAAALLDGVTDERVFFFKEICFIVINLLSSTLAHRIVIVRPLLSLVFLVQILNA